MKHARHSVLILILAMAGITASAYAQQASDAPNTPAEAQSTAPPADSTPSTAQSPAAQAPTASPTSAKASAPSATADPSLATIKKARDAGFRTEFVHGVAQYCKYDAVIGTRFQTKRCMNELQLENYLLMLDSARDAQRQNTVCNGGGSCNGGH